MQFSYLSHLNQVGLTTDEAKIYEVLVRNGTLTASAIANMAQVSRTLSYKILDDLIKKDLVKRIDEPKSVSKYTASHPATLHKLLEKRDKELENAKIAVKGILEPMSSDFNLAVGKPGVEFYEGKAGVKAVLDDSLTARETIMSYANLDAISSFFPEVNKEYVKDRERLGVHKRGIVPDTEQNRRKIAGYASKVTETRFIKGADYDTIVQIYDDKVSFLTLTNEHQVGIIIHDKSIYNVHKAVFNSLWEHVTPVVE